MKYRTNRWTHDSNWHLSIWSASVTLIVICLIGVFVSTYAQECETVSPKNARRLFKVADHEGHFGYIDKTGKIVIGFDRLPKTTAWVSDFSEGLAAFGLPAYGIASFAVGYIDETGRVVIEPTFFLGGDFRNGHAVVGIKEGQRIINRCGQIVDFDRNLLNEFSEGLAAVKGGFIDRSGKQVILGFAATANFSEGLAAAATSHASKFGFINSKGEFVIPPRFEPRRDQHNFIMGLSRFSEGLASVRVGDLWGYINKKGDFVIPPQFREAGDFSEGLAYVSTPEKNGYIDSAGQWVIVATEWSQSYGNFKEGLAPVSFKIGKVGYINRAGKLVIPPRYDWASVFENGIATVYEGHAPNSIYASYTGYIDRTGKYIWEPQAGRRTR